MTTRKKKGQPELPVSPELPDCTELDSETRFQLIAETIEDVFWMSTPGIERMIYISPAYEKIWGRSTDSLYAEPQSFLNTIHPEDRKRVWAGIAEHARGGWEHEYRIFDAQGRLRWIHDHGYPIYDEQGELSCLVGIASDITHYKQSEEKLRQNQYSLAEAQRIAKLGNWDWDIINNTLHWSDEIYRVFGLQPQQFAATYEAFLARIHPEDRDDVTAAVNAALYEGEKYFVDHRIELPNGEQRIVHEQGEVIFDAQEKPVRMIGTVQDITEVKHTEQALRRANRALRTLSSCNEMLVHARNENELLQDICQIIINVGGYRMAWVGYAEYDANKSVRPVAHAGYEQGYMEKVRVSWADTERGRGPVGAAIRDNQTQIVRDVQAEPSFTPWRGDAIERGYHSVMALPLTMDGEAFGSLAIYALERDAFDQQEVKLLQEMASDLGYGIHALRTQLAHEQANERERRLLMDTIGAMAMTIEKRDPYTAGHQARVTRLAVAIAEEMGYDEHRVEGLRLAASVHDIGKIYVPAEILNRPGRLMPSEFEVIKTHVEVGYDILKQIDFPWPVADIVNQHHERMDGSGYPNGLQGEEILPEARILAVSDVVESIQSHRPYRPALGVNVALEEIEQNRGSKYAPEVVEACLRLFREQRFNFE